MAPVWIPVRVSQNFEISKCKVSDGYIKAHGWLPSHFVYAYIVGFGFLIRKRAIKTFTS